MSTSARTTARTSSRSIPGWSRACTSSPGTAPGRWPRCSVCPGLAGYASKLHPLVLDTLFISLVLLAVLRLVQEPAPGNAALFGAGLGGCVLTRPTILAFLPFALAWVFYRQRTRRGAAYAALGLVIAVIIVSPWVIRNYVVLGTFVLTRTTTGYVFWLGNHPGATGGASDASGKRSLFDVAPLELRQRILATDELAQNRIFLSEALQHVRGAPAAFGGRAMTKLSYFWWVAPSVSNISALRRRWPSSWPRSP